jgi:hypothetical protein
MDQDDASIATLPDASGSIDALIERWWAEHFPGSPVSQVTQAWNHAFAAKEDLKRLLADFSSETASR